MITIVLEIEEKDLGRSDGVRLESKQTNSGTVTDRERGLARAVTAGVIAAARIHQRETRADVYIEVVNVKKGEG